jgi:hypothetical protein
LSVASEYCIETGASTRTQADGIQPNRALIGSHRSPLNRRRNPEWAASGTKAKYQWQALNSELEIQIADTQFTIHGIFDAIRRMFMSVIENEDGVAFFHHQHRATCR